jgi:hypothetical protein
MLQYIVTSLLHHRWPVRHSRQQCAPACPEVRRVSPFPTILSALFHFPYPVTPLLATLTKTAGCVPTIPKMVRPRLLLDGNTLTLPERNSHESAIV